MKNENTANQATPARGEAGSAAPYFLAWMLGAPTSLLVLIYLIRG